MVEKLPTVKHYSEIIDKLVCNKDKSLCMPRKCSWCPGPTAEERRLQQIVDEAVYDADDMVTYSQWTTVDRSNIITPNIKTMGELIESISEKSDLTPHHLSKKNCQDI